MLEKFRKPALAIAILGAVKLVTDAFGLQLLTNDSINEIANFIAGATVNTPERPGEYKTTLADNSKARELLGWAPTRELPEAIAQLLEQHGITKV